MVAGPRDNKMNLAVVSRNVMDVIAESVVKAS